MFQTGVHLIQRDELRRLGGRMPRASVGVVDLVRTVEGLLPEPVEGEPLFVVGLVTAIDAAVEPANVGAVLRGLVVSGRSYFEWKRIPLVFVTRATLDGALEDGGPMARVGGRTHRLAAFFGQTLKPRTEGRSEWWWAPQMG